MASESDCSGVESRAPGRPTIPADVQELIATTAAANRTWVRNGIAAELLQAQQFVIHDRDTIFDKITALRRQRLRRPLFADGRLRRLPIDRSRSTEQQHCRPEPAGPAQPAPSCTLGKKGALLFFGRAGCVQCHAVGGQSNEMFSDFEMHVVGVPRGSVPASHVAAAQRRRAAGVLQRRVHEARGRDPASSGHVGARLSAGGGRRGQRPAVPAGSDRAVLDRLDPLLAAPQTLSGDELASLVAFVRTGLLDPRALPQHLCSLVPPVLPSGMTPLRFEGCPQTGAARPGDR